MFIIKARATYIGLLVFSLYDMNHDEIPELFIGWQNAEGYMEDCTMFRVGNGYEDSLVEYCILQINPKDQKIMSSDIYHLCENYYFYSYDGNNAILDYSLLWENPQVVDVDSSRWSMRVGDAMSDVEITMPQYQDIVESYMTDDMFTPIGKLMNAYNLKRYFDIDLNVPLEEVKNQNQLTEISDPEQDTDMNTDMEILFFVSVDAPDGYVNFRMGPSTENPILAEIPNGTLLPAYSINAAGDWYQVKYGEQIGFVARSQVAWNNEDGFNQYITDEAVRAAIGVPTTANATVEYSTPFWNDAASAYFVNVTVTGIGSDEGFVAAGEFEISEGWLGGGVLMWGKM